jgi:sugar O-acyltransferase (sialic acid O-acetyltransferase NeuD family)
MTSDRQDAVILGAGGHARVLIDLLLRTGTPKPVAVVDRDRSLIGREILGVPVVGDDAALADFDPRYVVLVNGVGSVRSTAARRDLYVRCRELGCEFATLVHPTAVLGSGVELGHGAQVLATAVVNTGAYLGENCIINTAAVIEHDCRIGAHAHVASGATLAGGVTLQPGVHVGAGATLIQGVTVGARTVVGAGAVVIGDLAEDTVAVGVPARALAKT